MPGSQTWYMFYKKCLKADSRTLEPLDQVFSVASGRLLRVLPSAKDEVNAAAFHPLLARLCFALDLDNIEISDFLEQF